MTQGTAISPRPAYLGLLEGDGLAARAEAAYRRLEDCDLCPRYCHVNRLETTRGAVCRTGERVLVSSAGPHHGEERPLSGWNGSGTIFFSWCNLRCVFCQNWDISHKGLGHEAEPEEMADMMLRLQDMGCHNINLVSPSQVVAQIIALDILCLSQQAIELLEDGILGGGCYLGRRRWGLFAQLGMQLLSAYSQERRCLVIGNHKIQLPQGRLRLALLSVAQGHAVMRPCVFGSSPQGLLQSGARLGTRASLEQRKRAIEGVGDGLIGHFLRHPVDLPFGHVLTDTPVVEGDGVGLLLYAETGGDRGDS